MSRMLAEAEARPVQGWDFGWLAGRMQTSPLGWSFEEVVAAHAEASTDLLDLETGGGEWLSALRIRPPRTVATESWSPNVEVAGSRLRPLGVTVVCHEAAPDNVEQTEPETRGRLPFPSGSFSLISNRHGTFVAAEVARVLADGGTFVTQQVGGDYDDFYDALELPRPQTRAREWDVRLASEQVERAGLQVTDSDAGLEETTFADVGAFAWYLKAIPWVVRDFSIPVQRERLERLQRKIDEEGPLAVRQPVFWLRAVKPR